MAIILFDKDESKAHDWLHAKNSKCFGFSPYEFILAGCGDGVIKNQREMLGLGPYKGK